MPCLHGTQYIERQEADKDARAEDIIEEDILPDEFKNMFDDLEEEMYKVGVDKEVDLPPPTKIEIFLRKIGTPILVYYASLRKRVRLFFEYYYRRIILRKAIQEIKHETKKQPSA